MGKRGRIILMAVLLVTVFFISFSLGRYSVPPAEVIKILLSRIFPIEKTWTDYMEAAVINIRLPRIIMACLVGSCLSAAGSAYQGVFRNPMASPDILGASSGAAFGAALAILLGAGNFMITAFSFSFSLISVGVVYIIGKKAPGQKIIGLILAGIMISSLLEAGTSYIKLVADPGNQLPAITYWLMGSLSGTKTGDIGYVIIPMALGLIPLNMLRWRINLLTLGDEEARSMGVNTDLLRLVVVACATLITAASVSVSGMIGWIGLVVPHICRRLVGNNYRYLLPSSMIFGAGFLLLVDDVSRNLLATQIPLGILTAVVGAPFFIYLMLKGRSDTAIK